MYIQKFKYTKRQSHECLSVSLFISVLYLQYNASTMSVESYEINGKHLISNLLHIVITCDRNGINKFVFYSFITNLWDRPQVGLICITCWYVRNCCSRGLRMRRERQAQLLVGELKDLLLPCCVIRLASSQEAERWTLSMASVLLHRVPAFGKFEEIRNLMGVQIIAHLRLCEIQECACMFEYLIVHLNDFYFLYNSQLNSLFIEEMNLLITVIVLVTIIIIKGGTE